jgi:hypothetical protein
LHHITCVTCGDQHIYNTTLICPLKGSIFLGIPFFVCTCFLCDVQRKQQGCAFGALHRGCGCCFLCISHTRRLLNIVGYSASSATRHRRLLDIVGYSTSSATQHRRLLDIVGYSTSSVTRHRRLLNIVGYSTSSATQHRRLLNIVGYSTSSTLSILEIWRLIKTIQDY